MEEENGQGVSRTVRVDAWVGPWDLVLELLGTVDADATGSDGELSFLLAGPAGLGIAGIDETTPGRVSCDTAPRSGGEVFIPGGLNFFLDGRPKDLVAFLACSGRGRVVEIVPDRGNG